MDNERIQVQDDLYKQITATETEIEELNTTKERLEEIGLIDSGTAEKIDILYVYMRIVKQAYKTKYYKN